MNKKNPFINITVVLLVSFILVNISINSSIPINKNKQITILDSSDPDIIISSIPPYTEFAWGQVNATLTWEAQGGDSWSLWRNGTFIRSGEKISDVIEIKIEIWQQEKWRLGYYNLTLEIHETDSSSATSSILIKINFEVGDEYANSFVRTSSIYYESGENAIGSPDKKNATIFPDYGNGILVLDMGINEEIINGAGNDFEIVAEGGNYTIWGGNELGIPFTIIGQNQGNYSFDLSSAGLESARYIHIEYSAGIDVEVDAIKALNFNIPLEDFDPPIISGPSDFWIWENQTSISLIWNIKDITPWNFSISVNGTRIKSGSWNGSEIIFDYNWTEQGNLSINLECYDLFNNYAQDLVYIEIRIIEIKDEENFIGGFSLPILLVIVSISEFIILINKRNQISTHKKK